MRYKTAIVENTWLTRDNNDFGWGNGYVSMPKDHPFHGLNYDIINHYVNVHGLLTYSKFCEESDITIFGFDHSNIGDWVVGFDTAHYGDTLEKWHKAAIQAETDYLLSQIVSCANVSKEDIQSKIKEYEK